MTQSRFFSSVAQPNSLQSNINSSTNSIPLAVAPIGYPVNTPFTIAIDYGDSIEELCDVTAVAGSVFTVTRAVDGTSAASHNVGAAIRHVSSARDFNEDNAHVNSSMGVHGLAPGSSVVGTTDTQTLTNKTFVNPSFSGTIPSLSLGVSNPIGVSPLVIQSSSGQTVSNLVINDSTGAPNLALSNLGSLNITPTDTTAQDFLKVNPGAPNTASNLLRLQNAGSDRLMFSAIGKMIVTYTGNQNAVNVTPTATSGGGYEVDLIAGSTGFYFVGKTNAVTNFSVDSAGNILARSASYTGPGNTFTAIAAGGAIRSSTTATIDANLVGHVDIGTWKLEGDISYSAVSGSSGITIIVGATGATVINTSLTRAFYVGPGDPTVTNLNTQSGLALAPVFGTAIGTSHVVHVSAILVVTTAGPAGISWGCNVAGSSLSIDNNSWLTFTRLA